MNKRDKNKVSPPQFCESKTKRGDKCPSVYLKTFGCQMNNYDSEILMGLLKKRGFVLAENLESADIALFNTCSVREHAEARVWGQVRMLAKSKAPRRFLPRRFADANLNAGTSRNLSAGDTRPNKKIIGLVGCMAQAHKDRIFKELPHVDLVCGPHHIYQIPDYLEDIISNKKKILAIDERERPIDRENHQLRDKVKDVRAYVTIMEGCNNFCSYCIVPFVRGREKSRPPELIVKEIETLLKKGIKEITLLGQNVNSYGRDFKNGYSFIDLLKDVDNINELRRLRFVTSHPKDASQVLFEVMSKLPTICEYLHLPVQSGSNRILKSMNRKYTKEDYLRKIEILKKLIPDCSLSTDIIVGFPGETDEDFKETTDIMRQVKFDCAYIFKYSMRPLTQASKLKDDVPQKIKEERNQELLSLQRDTTLHNNRRFLNGEVGVLVESVSDKCNNHLVGRTRSDRVVIFEGPKELIGKIVEVEIKEINTSTLLGDWKRL